MVLAITSCGDTMMDAPVMTPDVPQAQNEDPKSVVPSEQYKLECYRTEYYFSHSAVITS